MKRKNSLAQQNIELQTTLTELNSKAKTHYKIARDTMREYSKLGGSPDQKFILVVTPEQHEYLEYCMNFKGLHKSQVVRDALDGIIQRDREYRVFNEEELSTN